MRLLSAMLYLSKFLSWCVQRIASLGLLALLLLLYLALWHDTPSHGASSSSSSSSPGSYPSAVEGFKASKAQLVFICYTIFAHLMGTLVFPIRLCWATWSVTKQLVAASKSPKNERRSSIFRERTLLSDKLANADVYEESCSSRSSSSESDTLCESPATELSFSETPMRPLHAVIVPNYKEDIETLKETLEVLACHPLARSTYEVRSL